MIRGEEQALPYEKEGGMRYIFLYFNVPEIFPDLVLLFMTLSFILPNLKVLSPRWHQIPLFAGLW